MNHNHNTRDIKPEGVCPECDKYRAIRADQIVGRDIVKELKLFDPNTSVTVEAIHVYDSADEDDPGIWLDISDPGIGIYSDIVRD